MLGGHAGSALPIEEDHGMHGFLTDAVPCLSIHVLASQAPRRSSEAYNQTQPGKEKEMSFPTQPG